MTRRACPAFAAVLREELDRRWPGQSVHTLVTADVLPQAAYAWARGERVPTLRHLLELQTALALPASLLVTWIQALGTDGVEWAVAVNLLVHEHIPRVQWAAALDQLRILLDVASTPRARLTEGSGQATDVQ